MKSIRLVALVLLAACTGDMRGSRDIRGGGSAATPASGTSGTTGSQPTGTGGDGFGNIDASVESMTPRPDARVRDPASCFTCKPKGGNYCGVIGDGCGSKMDCG